MTIFEKKKLQNMLVAANPYFSIECRYSQTGEPIDVSARSKLISFLRICKV